ncbi:MAG: DUF4474 domain-containing protein [Lachnospiraceae bacterium]|nr:DUF4474 domain-containing protein [Lachnospiraceae bacterium]
MYFSIIIVIFALLLILVLGTCRKRWAIKKVCSMTSIEKCELLNSLIKPFGYCYDKEQDLISSRNDAWQREAGYTALFDRSAPLFNMVFDYLPVYFPYQNQTWLIELWKGQYGINTGAEIGVYYADHLLSETELPTAHFKVVSDCDMLPLSFCLTKEKVPIASVSKRTWWLTAFCMGQSSKPEQLYLNASIIFPDYDMMHSFLDALHQTNLSQEFIKTCGNEIRIQYGGPQDRHYNCFQRLIRAWSQFTNRIFCRIYLYITRYFCLTVDKLLYLYYLLPFAFRKMLKPRRCCRCKNK